MTSTADTPRKFKYLAHGPYDPTDWTRSQAAPCLEPISTLLDCCMGRSYAVPMHMQISYPSTRQRLRL